MADKTPIEINIDFMKPYINGMKRHKNYRRAREVAYHLQFHFDGYRYPWGTAGGATANDPTDVNPTFVRLIDTRRPGESDVTRDYRRQRYTAITKEPCSKVINSLKKIVKSPDWGIIYDEAEAPASLPKEDGLQEYCEKNFPKDDSIENWARKNLIRWLLLDPNSLIVVMPLSWEVEPSELFRPYPHIIPCKDVYDFKDNEYCVFLSPYINEYQSKDGRKIEGKIYGVMTQTMYYEFRQCSDTDYEQVEYVHNIGEMPAWIMGGESRSTDIRVPFYESFVHGMLPQLDNAAVDQSDLEAEKVQHLFSTMWTTQSSSCSNCQGTGNVLLQGKQSICASCNGRGTTPFSPYRTLEVNLNANGLDPSKQIPVPPAGYISKPSDMVKLMMEIIDTEIYRALSAINFEFLAENPLNQSGTAKAIDRDELNNFVFGIAQHLVRELIEPIYYFINEFRYGVVIPDKDTRNQMLPHIPVPEHFDFITQRDAEDNLIKITAADVSEDLKELAEMNYIHGKFSDVPEALHRLTIVHDHDPFPGKDPADLQVLLTAGLVKKEDVVLSVYIKPFVAQILAEGDKFVLMDFEEQHQVLMTMAAEKLESMKAEQAIKDQAKADMQAKAVQNLTGKPPVAGIDPLQQIKDAKKPVAETVANVPNKIKDRQTQDPNSSNPRNSLANS